MKKLFAVLIALTLLALPFASAESVFYFADPSLSMNMGGEDSNIDLAGLELCAAADVVGDALAAKIFVNGKGQSLFAVDVNLKGDDVLFTASGLSDVYSVAIPEEALEALQSVDVESAFTLPDEVMDKIAGIVAQNIELNEDSGTFSIPYTAVNDILTELVPYLDKANIPGLDVADVQAKIGQLKQANSGFNLEGSFSTDENGGMAFDLSVILVQNGVADENAVLSVLMVAADNTFMLLFDAGDTGSLGVTYLDGELSLAVNADGSEMVLSGKVGTREEDVALVALDAANAIDVTTLDEEGTEKLSQEIMMGASGLFGYLMPVFQLAA